MRVLFDYHKLLSVVENGVTEIVENVNDAQKHAHRESTKKDKKALYFIHQEIKKPIKQVFQSQVSIKGDQGGETSQKHSGSRSRGRGRGFYFNKGHGGHNNNYGVGGNDQEKSNFDHQQNSKGCGHGCGRGRYDKSNVECYHCHKHGHYSNECKCKDNTQKAHCVQGDDDVDGGHALLMVIVVGETPNYHIWFLDTRCTNHMSGKRELFVDLDESFHTKVKFVDNRTIPVIGKRRILINLKNGNHKYISNVFYIPSMKSNLLSVGQLLEKGYVMSLRDHQFSILDNQDSEPMTFEEAIQDSKWVNVMNEEIKPIERNNTWVLTDIPQGHKAIDVKWVFKTKVKSNGETIKLIIGLVAQNQWKIHQMDVNSAFLSGPLEEEVYVQQPPGFMKQGSEDKVNNYGDILLLSIYVDDLIFTGNNPTMIEDSKKSMMDNCAILGYSDSDWVGDLDDQKSTSRCYFNFGATTFSWSSKSSLLLLYQLVKQNLAKNPVTHGRSKHIDVRYHFLRDQVGKKAIELVYCKSENQVANILTKPLKFEAFIKLRSMLGMTTLLDQD
ncbi:hypothetical protein SLEP1_g6248 [Rubroshorea leprosula]|uniref:CCHC-type domain-containing protein n=1 Tax=Rubroshorea leprosula TaxID=152421 RepID=A0AAV5I0F7_9ROSI|nr:hypothetical protein SLEP1_g6248 [Rubroshorea leprosula]